MAKPKRKMSNAARVLIALIAVQATSAAFFIVDVMADFRVLGPHAAVQLHFYIESAATVSLVAAIFFEVNYLLRLLRREAHLENSLRIAGSAIHDVIEAEFEGWRLTPAEQDVATFLVKWLNTAEIAEMRGSAEGTVKAHLNAIYRKSGTRNRAEMLSVLIDTIMGRPDRA
jgi:DNA-binding CsgD family transcriptional regulator